MYVDVTGLGLKGVLKEDKIGKPAQCVLCPSPFHYFSSWNIDLVPKYRAWALINILYLPTQKGQHVESASYKLQDYTNIWRIGLISKQERLNLTLTILYPLKCVSNPLYAFVSWFYTFLGWISRAIVTYVIFKFFKLMFL